MKYEYIPNEFGRTWVASKNESRRGVFTPLAYIDINEGNRFDADVFAQIMYWHEPNNETGQSRLSRFKDGFYWLTKNHADWFAETRIKYSTVRKCLDRLKTRRLIFYESHGEKGNVCPWIRINWDEFERRMQLWLQETFSEVTAKDYDKRVTIFATPATTGQGVCPTVADPLLPDSIPLLPQVKSNTESTSKSTTKTTQSPARTRSTSKKFEREDFLIDIWAGIRKLDAIRIGADYHTKADRAAAAKLLEWSKPPTEEEIRTVMGKSKSDAYAFSWLEQDIIKLRTERSASTTPKVSYLTPEPEDLERAAGDFVPREQVLEGLAALREKMKAV